MEKEEGSMDKMGRLQWEMDERERESKSVRE